MASKFSSRFKVLAPSKMKVGKKASLKELVEQGQSIPGAHRVLTKYEDPDWTVERKAMVYTMVQAGLPIDDICTAIGVNSSTLYKHCKEEISKARVFANLKVGDTLYKMATSGKCPAATIFWAKTKAGFTEKITLDGEMKHVHTATIDPAKLSVEQLKQLEAAITNASLPDPNTITVTAE